MANEKFVSARYLGDDKYEAIYYPKEGQIASKIITRKQAIAAGLAVDKNLKIGESAFPAKSKGTKPSTPTQIETVPTVNPTPSPSRPGMVSPSASPKPTSKAGGNNPPRPSFDVGPNAGSTETDDIYKVEVGFGLVDKNGLPLSLPPIQIGSYVTTLAGTDPKAYARVKAAVVALSGRKKVDPSYVGGYVSKLAQNIMASSDIVARSGNLEDFFKKASQAAGTGTQPSPPQSYISSPSQAKGDINKIFGDLLGRQATDKELKALTSVLNDAQKKNPSKYVDGVTYGGLDKEQFLIDLITTGEYAANPKAFPGILGNIANEVAQKQATLQEQGILKTEDVLKGVAVLNDVPLSQDQLDIYRSRIEAGEDVNLIKKEIRRLASIGQPDSIKQMIEQGADLSTIYDPYRKIMGTVLEINPNSIPLNDPTLRMAIGPDKEMSLYEYQKSLRKDPRWEYTNQARTETANAITTVLRDFGFMG